MSYDKSRGSAALSSGAAMRQPGESPAPRRRVRKEEETGWEGGEEREKTGKRGGTKKASPSVSLSYRPHTPSQRTVSVKLHPEASLIISLIESAARRTGSTPPVVSLSSSSELSRFN